MAGRSQFGADKEDSVGFTTVSEFVASLKSAVQNAEGLVFAEDILKREIEGNKKENKLLQEKLRIEELEKLRLEKDCGDLKELACRLREERDVLGDRLNEKEDLKELACHLREEPDVLRNRLKENEDYQNKIVELKRKNCELECQNLRAKTDVDIYQSRIHELERKILSLGKDASMSAETNEGKRKGIREISAGSEAHLETNVNPSDGSSHIKRKEDRALFMDSDDEYASNESASEMVVTKRQLEKAHSEHEAGVHESTSDMEIEKDASVNLTTTETNSGKRKVRETIVRSEALSKTNANPSGESPRKTRRVVKQPVRATPYCEQHGRRRFVKYQGLAFGNPIPIVHDRASLLWTQCLTKDYPGVSRVDMSIPGKWYSELPTAVRARVDGTCFRSLICCLVGGGQPTSYIYLTSLVERWSDTTHTFHFPVGELTVTPLDVAAITGLSFKGSPPPFGSRLFKPEVDVDLVQDLTGIHFDESCRDRFILDTILVHRWRWKRTPPVGADIDRYARAYLWFVLRCILFHSPNNKADLAILEALRDLDNLGSYSWGSSVLASSYRGLDERCRGSYWMSGLPCLVEIWGYEYGVLQCHWTKIRDRAGFPRLKHWKTKRDNEVCIKLARRRLNALAWDQIRPHPWGLTEKGWLPEMVHARYITSRRVLLEDHLDRSWYLGELVFDFDRGVAARRVPRPPPKLMFWGADLPDEVELEALMKGIPVEGYPGQPETALLEPFMEGAYESFIIEHLLGPIGSRAVDKRVPNAPLQKASSIPWPQLKTQMNNYLNL